MIENEDQPEKPKPKTRKEARRQRRQEHTPTPGSSHHRRRGDNASGPATMHEDAGTHNKKTKGGSKKRWRP